MASLAIPVAVGGSLLQFEGQRQAGKAAKERGRRQKVASDFKADQLEQQAGQAIATSQRNAGEERRRGNLVASRALALAAAGGGGVSDPTMVNLFSDLSGESAYRSAVALYQGEEQARQLRMGAAAERYSGDMAEQGGAQQQQAYNLAGLGSLAQGASSLYMKYGGGGPMTGEERYGAEYDAYNQAGY